MLQRRHFLDITNLTIKQTSIFWLSNLLTLSYFEQCANNILLRKEVFEG